MRVLHVTPYFAPAWAFGPVPDTVCALARAQAARGHDVAVLTTDALAPHERLASGEALVDGVRVLRVRNVSSATRTWLSISTPLGFRAAARRLLATGVDLVHAHELRTIENAVLCRVVPAAVPLVVSPHGTLGASRPPSPVLRAWDAVAGSRVLRRTDLVLAATEAEADAVRTHWRARGQALEDDRVAVVADGVDLAAYERRPTPQAARQQLGLPAEGPVVLYLGDLRDAPALVRLVEAFASVSRRFPEARLVLAGPDRGAGPAVRAALVQHDCLARTHLAGYVAGDTRLAVLAAADLVVMPGREVRVVDDLLAAMTCGLPTLAASRVELPAGLPDDVGMLVADPSDWADTIASLLADAPLRDTLATRARAAAAQATWDAVAARVDAAYERARLTRAGRAGS